MKKRSEGTPQPAIPQKQKYQYLMFPSHASWNAIFSIFYPQCKFIAGYFRSTVIAYCGSSFSIAWIVRSYSSWTRAKSDLLSSSRVLFPRSFSVRAELASHKAVNPRFRQIPFKVWDARNASPPSPLSIAACSCPKLGSFKNFTANFLTRLSETSLPVTPHNRRASLHSILLMSYV